ncbi:MBL fold metallo-hydrolase [Limnovirga soli]|uniref:MBL fold metallo-hydrolase n=1 Tax=Limnovirga soli TaxID=2656915 RepID=A0A8J8FER3_9BACT|nr:MBL fold metallo-hydrolase [Limnovirga soli]NNV55252.1 MBL fold metallo-hydrolase [Limnovirga soli]
MSILKIFGSNPSGKHLEALMQSPNYQKSGFTNISVTPVMSEDGSFIKTTRDYINKPKTTAPPAPLPFIKTNLHQLNGTDPVIVWFGHSSYFIRVGGKNFLIDPVFSGNAAPFSFMVKAFPGSNEYTVADMPPIDYLILTHDHYDHLDYHTIIQLQPKVNSVYCSLGVGAHLQFWGYPAAIIHEMDWWQTHQLDTGIQLTAAPARHFSGRGMVRAKTLWSSFVLEAAGYRLYLGGDSGYDTHFKAIGNRFGRFDIAILESGQYNPSWAHIHMMPEQTVQAAADLNAALLLPVHWAKFTLALHPWNEPVQRVLAHAAQLNIPVTTPKIGEPVIINQAHPNSHWWQF